MKKVVFIITAAVLVLSSCTSRYASNGETIYLRSQNGPNLTVPPPLTSANISHFYDLPYLRGNSEVSIEPPIGHAT